MPTLNASNASHKLAHFYFASDFAFIFILHFPCNHRNKAPHYYSKGCQFHRGKKHINKRYSKRPNQIPGISQDIEMSSSLVDLKHSPHDPSLLSCQVCAEFPWAPADLPAPRWMWSGIQSLIVTTWNANRMGENNKLFYCDWQGTKKPLQTIPSIYTKRTVLLRRLLDRGENESP